MKRFISIDVCHAQRRHACGTHLLVGGVLNGDDLLHAVYLGSLLCHRLDVAAGNECVHRSSQLLRGRDGAQGAVVELAISLLQNREGRCEPPKCGGAEGVSWAARLRQTGPALCPDSSSRGRQHLADINWILDSANLLFVFEHRQRVRGGLMRDTTGQTHPACPSLRLYTARGYQTTVGSAAARATRD